MTLVAAATVPVAVAPDGPARTPRPVRGAAAGAPIAAADQIRAREWHLEAVRAKKAWKWSTGQGVTVAVLDTGVDADHPDLVGSVVAGPDLTGGGRRPGSRYWGLHGTSMASIIAGHGHGRGDSEGMMGVAPQTRIMSIRVTLENDDPLRRAQRRQNGDGDAIARGIRYAVDNGADIVNMSLGGGQQYYNGTPAQASAIEYALDRGVVLIASAGNDGSAANRKNYPAAYPGVIAVGALDRRLRLWENSNRHSHVSVCAPGVDIVSADNGKGYVVGTGTSASSAIVAGVAALVRARYPRLTPDEVRRALVQGSPARSGHPTGSANCKGTVDAVRTLVAAHRLNKTSTGPVRTPTPTPTPAPVAEPADEGSGMLMPIVLGGGGVLLLLGVTLGWRQRGRPEDEEAMPEYGLPGPPPDLVPRSASSGEGAPPVAPVNATLWQNTQVQPPPGYDDPDEPVRFEPRAVPHPVPHGGERRDMDMGEQPTPRPGGHPPPPRPDEPGRGRSAPHSAGGGLAREHVARRPGEQPAPHEGDRSGPGPGHESPRPIPGPGERPAAHGSARAGERPTAHEDGRAPRPGPHADAHPPVHGHNFADDANFANGRGPAPHGTPANGSGGETGEIPVFDDEEWARFRRSALAGTGFLDTAPQPAVQPLPDQPDAPPSPPGRSDGPAAEEDDYRPPWW